MSDISFKINFDEVLENLGGDAELLSSTLSLSLRIIPQHVEKIRRALNEKNFKNLEVSAHTLKGSLGIYLYKPITNLAFELEKMGRSESFEKAPETFQNLEEHLKCFYQNLESYSSKLK